MDSLELIKRAVSDIDPIKIKIKMKIGVNNITITTVKKIERRVGPPN